MRQVKSEQEQRFAEYYRRYELRLIDCDVLDFDDLITKPTHLLDENQKVRSYWQQKIRYLLVDEYQDINTSQYKLLKLLVGNRGQFTVVGDDDQSSYS